MSPGPEFGLLAALVLGLIGSGHCVGMCGGIACALGLGIERDGGGRARRTLCLAGYQLGRIASYALAGAMLGALGMGLVAPMSIDVARVFMHLLQAATLIALGLYLSGLWTGPVAALERLGARGWRALAPLRRRLLPVRGPAQAMALGSLWGWLPCGLVYSALALALSAGEALMGALHMLAFGLGTVPAMLAASTLGERIARMPARGRLRRAAGVAVLVAGSALGVLGIAHATMRDTGSALDNGAPASHRHRDALEHRPAADSDRLASATVG